MAWAGVAMRFWSPTAAACGADSGDDEEGVGTGFLPEGGDLFGGADHAVDS